MIHDSVGGGLVGAILIFGGMWVGIIAGATAALAVVAKGVGILQTKPAAQEQGEGAA